MATVTCEEQPVRHHQEESGRFYGVIALMATSATILSGAIIFYFNHTVNSETIASISNSVQLAAVTLMPYMISAAVAAITAIGIVTILPLTRLPNRLQSFQDRLAGLAAGDLASRIRIEGDHEQIKALSREMNSAIGELGNRVAQLKLINRQQWDLLESIRYQAGRKDTEAVLMHVGQMEKNWEKIAVIEERLVT